MKHYTLRVFQSSKHRPQNETIRKSEVVCILYLVILDVLDELQRSITNESVTPMSWEKQRLIWVVIVYCVFKGPEPLIVKFLVKLNLHGNIMYYSRIHCKPSLAEMSILRDMKYLLTMSWDIYLIHNTQNQDVPADFNHGLKGRWIKASNSLLETISVT